MKPYAKTYHKNSSLKTATEIRDLYFKRVYNQTELAKIYKIPQSSISKTVSGFLWPTNI